MSAPTTDQVSLIADWRYMDHNSGKDVWRSKRIPLQEAGFTRNGWDYYDLLIDQFAIDSEDVQALTLFKQGRDAWCFDRVQLMESGRVRWSFDARTDRSAEAYILQRPAGNIWLNDVPSDVSRSRSARFSDLKIAKGSWTQAPTTLEITTCPTVAGGRVEDDHPGTRDAVTVEFVHDGFREVVPITSAGTELAPGTLKASLLDEHGVRQPTELKITKQGTDDWCISRVQLITPEEQIFEAQTDVVLNSGGGRSPEIKWHFGSSDFVGGTSSTQAFAGLPLRRRGWTRSWPAKASIVRAELSGCDTYKLKLTVENTGAESGVMELPIRMSASGKELPGSCQIDPDSIFDQCTNSNGQLAADVDFTRSDVATARVTLDPGYRATVELKFNLSLPPLVGNVDFSLWEADIMRPISVASGDLSWDNPEMPINFVNDSVCLH